MKKLVLVLAACALVLSGCIIPSSGKVQRAPDVPTGGQNRYSVAVENNPVGVVTGFLNACSDGYLNNYAAARQLLAPDLAKHWDPYRSVTVYAGDSFEFGEGSDGAVVVKNKQLAHGTDYGLINPPGPKTPAGEFSVARNTDGKWRIVGMPAGLTLLRTRFVTSFDTVPLYWVNDGVLVADYRFLPKQIDPRVLVSALRNGPAPWLAQRVHNAVSAENQERVDFRGDDVEDTLLVALKTRGKADPREAASQLRATLAGRVSYGNLLVEVDGVAAFDAPLLSVPDTSKLALQARAIVDDHVVVLGEKQLGAGTVGGAVNLGLGRANLERIFYVAGEQLYAIGSTTALGPARALSPSVDSNGYAWVLEPGAADTVTVYDADNRGSRLRIEGLAGQVEFARVAPTGDRLAVLHSIEGKNKMALFSITRDGGGRPVKVDGYREIGHVIKQPYALSWMGPASLMVLTGNATDPSLHEVSAAGPVINLGRVPASVGLTADVGRGSIRLWGRDGWIYKPEGRGWNQVARARAPIYPG